MSDQHLLDEHCQNCDTPLLGHYCHHCGQETELEAPTMREFIHEYLHHYVALEGKLWQTLKLLLSKPGQLTLEFMRGRRQRYVKPLALYLTFSFMWFLLNSFTPTAINTGEEVVRGFEDGAASQMDKSISASVKVEEGGVEDLLRAKAISKAIELVQKNTPYIVFGLLPVYSFWLWLFYRRRKPVVGTHLVFAVHYHAWFFLVLLPITLLELMSREIPWQEAWVFVLWWGYLALALRRVYGGGRRSAWWRALCLMALHGFAVFLTLLGIAVGLTAYNFYKTAPPVSVSHSAK